MLGLVLAAVSCGPQVKEQKTPVKKPVGVKEEKTVQVTAPKRAEIPDDLPFSIKKALLDLRKDEKKTGVAAPGTKKPEVRSQPPAHRGLRPGGKSEDGSQKIEENKEEPEEQNEGETTEDSNKSEESGSVIIVK
jgi:hypothetical protein